MTCRPQLRGSRGSRGQASVELIAMLPLALLLVLGAAQLLAAGAAREQAAAAAAAGAVALLQGRDPQAAARAALDDWGKRASVRVDGRRIEVAVRPRALVPGIGRLLEASSTADAGPAS